MAYEKKVSTSNPHLSILIIDDSGSMEDSLHGTSDPKCNLVDQYSQQIIRMLLARCQTPSGDIRPRYFMDIILYGRETIVWQNSPKFLEIQNVVKILSENGYSFGLRGQLGGTDTKSAFELALQRLSDAMNSGKFDDSFPPIVFHLTDGLSHTDAENAAKMIKDISTNDGNVLVVNGYIGARTNLSYKGYEDFSGYIEESDIGDDEDNLRLFRMSSIMPDTIRKNLIDADIFPAIREKSKLFFDIRTKDMLKNVIQVVGSVEAGKGGENRRNR